MAKFGAEPYGPGTPPVAPALPGRARTSPFTGEQLGSRRIDPRTRDYVYDPATGRAVGMTNAQHLVYLAVKTTRGSSVMQSLGQGLSDIETIGDDIERRIDQDLRRAVQHVVDANIIEVEAVEVQRLRKPDNRTVMQVALHWRDIETGRYEVTPIGAS